MRRALALVSLAALAVGLAACGSSGTSAVAPPPHDPSAPVTGTLRVFAYEDTISDQLMAPFERANPKLHVETASFSSDQEAATKLAAGFEADVVESCLDEITPLRARGLLRPIDVQGVTDWNDLAFTRAEGVAAGPDSAWVVPLSAGPEGLIYDRRAEPTGGEVR